jgi:hypothetical protein
VNSHFIAGTVIWRLLPMREFSLGSGKSDRAVMG